jgi:5-hydroxyisourate hydrolase
MAAITTHVLDTSRGRPAAGLRVTLRRGVETLCDARTDADGRLRLLEQSEEGAYELTFATGEYNPDGFFPQVTIHFTVTDPGQHHHVPLLLSPFGYSTYRGS